MKQRIFYFDALKAFSILVVIIGHVKFFSLHMQDTIIWKFINIVNMPMFMFVSGILSGIPNLKGCIKRLRTMMLPTLVVGIIYTLTIIRQDIPGFFINSAHYGYWFCFTLFMYYFFASIVFKLIDVLRVSDNLIKCALLSGVTFVLLALSRVIPYENDLVQALSLQAFFKYLPFFVYGVILNHLPNIKEKIETNNYIFTFSLIILVASIYIAMNNAISQLIMALGYVNVMVYIFNRICKNKRSRIVEYVGIRTLDIYLFHYFLLPRFIVEIPTVFDPDTNILLTLTVVVFLSLLVLMGTLVCTKVIEYSKVLSLVMLGKRSS